MEGWDLCLFGGIASSLTYCSSAPGCQQSPEVPECCGVSFSICLQNLGFPGVALGYVVKVPVIRPCSRRTAGFLSLYSVFLQVGFTFTKERSKK